MAYIENCEHIKENFRREDGVLQRRWLILTAATLALCAFQTRTLFACEGTRTIFEDEFKDDSGGWNFGPSIRAENSSLVIESPAAKVLKALNIANGVKSADICVEVTFKDPPASKTPASAGLMFWATDFNNYFSLQIQASGTVGIFRFQGGQWLALRPSSDDSNVRTGQGAANVLRVKAVGNLVSLFVNGARIRDIRGEAPTSDWYFGVYGAGTNDKDTTTIFKHFKVTTPD